MLIDYDKTFPESARSLALDGARDPRLPVGVADQHHQPGARAWPRTARSRLFDLYDQARAAENQVVLASSNQTGAMGGMRFLGQAKVVGPGGDILARTWSKAGLAVAELDVDRRDRPRPAGAAPPGRTRPDAYRAAEYP